MEKHQTIATALQAEGSDDQLKMLTPNAQNATKEDIESLLNYEAPKTTLGAEDKVSLVQLARHRIQNGMPIYPWPSLDIEKDKVVAEGW